ncbi:DUF2946 domain-containing protein [Caballeronia sp. Lep1P3]|uniref:DUF2946 domain-containing protein n=1 Tax=Caballeronia sp. Lep1P3 TaxID=2878150 RepID=UPI001FD38CCF|nr:DUF2946 domain-containing protein [Caballeronia sp. Lep1P3]
MRRRIVRFTGSLLGLFAILLATLAPVVSQSLAGLHARDGEDAVHCEMESMPSMSMPSMHGEPHDASHPPTSSGDACAYCSLFAHTPAVVAPQIFFFMVVQAVLHRSASRFESVRVVAPPSPGQPRAPPFLLS